MNLNPSKSGLTMLFWIVPVLIFYSACEKHDPVALNDTDELDFSCESCHTNAVVLAQLAPDEGGGTAGGGG